MKRLLEDDENIGNPQFVGTTQNRKGPDIISSTLGSFYTTK